MFEDLTGKRVLVTGASSGLGAHFAPAMAPMSSRRRDASTACRSWLQPAPDCPAR